MQLVAKFLLASETTVAKVDFFCVLLFFGDWAVGWPEGVGDVTVGGRSGGEIC